MQEVHGFTTAAATFNYAFTTAAEAFSTQVWSTLGSDAKLLPVGNLATREYPGLEREIPEWEVLHYLGVNLEHEALCSFILPNQGVCATLHEVPTWPGYYLVVRTLATAGSTNLEKLLSVFKLYKMPTL
jgi:hypothetical protein